MKLLCVYNTDIALQQGMLLFAEVEGSHNDLLLLCEKLYDANELLDIKLNAHDFSSAIVASKDDEGLTSLHYTSIVTLHFIYNSSDTAQALSDIASNILHLIE